MEDHEDTWKIQERLATSLRDSGEVLEAVSCNAQIVEHYRMCHGAEHALMLEAQRRLAENYFENSQFSKAIEMYHAVVIAGSKLSAETVCQDRMELVVALSESGTSKI